MPKNPPSWTVVAISNPTSLKAEQTTKHPRNFTRIEERGLALHAV